MLRYVVAFLSGLMFIETVHSKPSKGRLPLINNLKAPLVAEIDVASINNELMEYIDNVIEDGLNATATRVDELIANLSTEVRETYLEKAKELFILQRKAEIEKATLESDILDYLQPKSYNRIDSKFETVDKNLTAKYKEFQKQVSEEIGILVNEKINAKLDKINKRMEAHFEELTNRLDIINATKNEPRDCTDIKWLSKSKSGVYYIFPNERTHIKVYCNMEVDDGGWTVIHRRSTREIKFERSWKEYELGFGNADGEYWIGNKYLNQLTTAAKYELRVDIIINGRQLYSKYHSFMVDDSSAKYKLTVGNYSGTAEEFLINNCAKFSTADEDNDSNSRNLAKEYGPWWYNIYSFIWMNSDLRQSYWGQYISPNHSMMIRKLN